MARENYFILLNLDPAEEDPARIEATIQAKQREWGALRTHPTKGVWAVACMSQLPNIRRVMNDAEQRKAEAEEAKRQLLHRQKEQLIELGEALKLLSAKGYVLEKELEALLKRESFKAFTFQNIKDRLSVPIKKGEFESEYDKITPLDASMAKEIEELLKRVD